MLSQRLNFSTRAVCCVSETVPRKYKSAVDVTSGALSPESLAFNPHLPQGIPAVPGNVSNLVATSVLYLELRYVMLVKIKAFAGIVRSLDESNIKMY